MNECKISIFQMKEIDATKQRTKAHTWLQLYWSDTSTKKTQYSHRSTWKASYCRRQTAW